MPQSPTAMSPASGGFGPQFGKPPLNARLQQVITGTHALSAPPTLLASTPLSPGDFRGTSSPAPQSSLATSLNSVGSDVEVGFSFLFSVNLVALNWYILKAVSLAFCLKRANRLID